VDDAKRNIVALAAFNLFRGAAVGGFTTLFPMYMASLGYDMGEIGAALSLGNALLALLLPGLGALIDYYGPRRMVVLTGALITTASLIAASTTSYPSLVAAYIIFLASFLVGQPARMSFLALAVGTGSLGTYVGITSSVFSASRTAGPALAGYLAGTAGYSIAFRTVAALALIGLLIFLALSREVGGSGGKASLASRVLAGYRRSLRPGRRFALLLAFIGLDRFAWALWFPLLTAHLYQSGFSEAEAGLVVSASGLVMTLAMPAAGLMVDRYGFRAGMALGEALGAVSALMLGTGEPILVWASAPLLGVSIAVWVPAYNKAIAEVAGGSAHAYATANTVRGLAGAPAPLVGGSLYEAVAPLAPFLLSSLLLAGATLLVVTVVPRGR